MIHPPASRRGFDIYRLDLSNLLALTSPALQPRRCLKGREMPRTDPLFERTMNAWARLDDPDAAIDGSLTGSEHHWPVLVRDVVLRA